MMNTLHPRGTFTEICSRLPKIFRKIVSTQSQVTHRASDFNPSPGIRVHMTLECGHRTWAPESRCPREKTACVLCHNALANQIFHLAEHVLARSTLS
jgi:hypothetical protein